MTSCLQQNAEEIVTEISMSHSRKPWLVVEGVSDATFFSSKFLFGNPIIVPAYGWENVVGIISKIIEESIVASVFGFIDRDYRNELGLSVNEKFVVITDFRDLEISLFESGCLHRILLELGSANKLPKLPCGSIHIEYVKEKIYSTAFKIGKLRYYSLKNSFNFPIQDLDFSKLINPKSLEVINEKLIAQLNSKSKHKINNEILEAAFSHDLPESLSDNKYICSGHDVIELLGISLKKLFGSNNSSIVAREQLEQLFRIGYSQHEFEQTSMFQKLNDLLGAYTAR